MKCRHLNGTAREIAATSLEVDFRNGQIDEGDEGCQTQGEIISRHYICDDCGKEWSWQYCKTERLPKWLQVVDERWSDHIAAIAK
jgi:hypothetical protein